MLLRLRMFPKDCLEIYVFLLITKAPADAGAFVILHKNLLHSLLRHTR
jgi:hypothetical protein